MNIILFVAWSDEKDYAQWRWERTYAQGNLWLSDMKTRRGFTSHFKSCDFDEIVELSQSKTTVKQLKKALQSFVRYYRTTGFI
jgi:hypothetical protein